MTFGNTKNIALKLITGAALAALLTSCGEASAPEAADNSAAMCEAKGAVLGELGPHKVCVFEENRQCSLDAVKGNRCIDYGYKITGYENDAQAFCAVSGHSADIDTNQCTLASGETCDIDAFWSGACPS